MVEKNAVLCDSVGGKNREPLGTCATGSSLGENDAQVVAAVAENRSEVCGARNGVESAAIAAVGKQEVADENAVDVNVVFVGGSGDSAVVVHDTPIGFQVVDEGNGGKECLGDEITGVHMGTSSHHWLPMKPQPVVWLQ